MLSKSVRIFCIPLLLLVLHAGIGMAQLPTIRLTGTVTDTTGALLPGVDVTLTNVDTGVTYSATSSGSGVYMFVNLPYGPYRLKCELPGFKAFVQQGILLETGFSRTVDVTLEVGEVTETVEVIARAPLLETESSDITQLLERETMLHVPQGSRRSASLSRLAPFVSYFSEQGTPRIVYMSMGGGKASNQNWTIDGGTVQGNSLVNPQLHFNPPMEAIQEFKIEVNNYTADMGRTLGGYVHMTTRSGTNEFHGALYEFFRHEKLDARTFFASTKGQLRYNIFGGSLGGPIWKNRTFFFVNVEQALLRTPSTFAGDDVPHPAERTGNFSARTDVVITDPVTGEPFPNNIIPPDRIDPVGAKVAQLYPLPNVSGDITKAPKNNLLVTDRLKHNITYPTVRIDHNQGDNDRFFFRWMQDDATETRPAAWEFDSRNRIGAAPHHNIMGGWNHTFSPTLLNDFRYMHREGHNFVTIGPGWGLGLNSQLGLLGDIDDALSWFKPSGLSSVGRSQLKRTDRETNQFMENLTFIGGNHTFKIGLELRVSNYRFQKTEAGSYDFSNKATGEGMASLLMGWVQKAKFSDQFLHSYSRYWSLYWMDDWKVTSKLTLNLGLRWALDEPFYRDPVNTLNGFDTIAINPVSGTPGIVTFAPFAETGKRAHRADWNNWGPRIGLAYRINPTTVIRAGAGIMYARPWEGSVAAKDLDAGNRPKATINSIDGGFTPPFLLKDGASFDLEDPVGQVKDDTFGAVPLGSNPRFSPHFVFLDQRTPYSEHWNFSIQKQLQNDMLLEIAYLANMGHKLVQAQGGASLNEIPLVSGRGPEKQSQALRPFPQFSGVNVMGPLWGNSSYHAGNIKFQRRFSAGLSFLTHYTWAKYLTDSFVGASLGSAASDRQHIELRDQNRSYSENQIAHRYLFSSVFDMPWGTGRRFSISNPVFNQIAGGWTLSTITELHSGPPFGVRERTSHSNTFSSTRPNLVGDPIITGSRSRGAKLAQWFNTSAFASPPESEFGDAARNYCCAPGLIGVDLSIQKEFPFPALEDWNLTFRTDIFNVLNRPHFWNVRGTHGSGDFGTIRNIVPESAGRQIQLSLRLDF